MGESVAADDFVLARADVSVAKTDNGVWIGNSGWSFTVKGNGTYELVTALLNRFDGCTPFAEVLAGSDEKLRPTVEALTKTLLQRGFAVLIDSPLSAYSDDGAQWLIPHFAQLTDSPAAAFRRMLTKRFVFLGQSAWLWNMRNQFEQWAPSGIRAEFITTEDEHVLPQSAVEWGDGDIAVLHADVYSVPELFEAQEELWSRAIPHCVAGWIDDQYWLLWGGSDRTGCWRCLQARRTQSSTSRNLGAELVDGLAASTLLRSLFSDAAEISSNPANHANAISISSDDVSMKKHSVTSMGGCACSRRTAGSAGGISGKIIRRDVIAPGDTDRPDDHHAVIVSALSSWTDATVGPFLTVDDASLSQVPFGSVTTEAIIASEEGPISGTERPNIRRTTVRTLSSREAYYQSALNTLEIIASNGAIPRTVGAGWTRDEAVYRALLRSLVYQPAQLDDVSLLNEQDLGTGDCARVFRYLHRAVERQKGVHEQRWLGRKLSNGLCHGVIDADGSLVHGYGVCYAEALSMASLAVVNDDNALVHVNPHFSTWDEVWQEVVQPSRIDDVTDTAPFVKNTAWLLDIAANDQVPDHAI